jgi:hypothetical protein
MMIFDGVDVGLKIGTHELGAVIVARSDATRDSFAEPTKLFLYGLPHWLKGFNRVPRLAA